MGGVAVVFCSVNCREMRDGMPRATCGPILLILASGVMDWVEVVFLSGVPFR